jgi:hypothetical protein
VNYRANPFNEPRTLNLIWCFLSLVLIALFIATAPIPDNNKYFTIDGPDYQQVSRTVFYSYRNSGGCTRVEAKSYPGFVEAHCYL